MDVYLIIAGMCMLMNIVSALMVLAAEPGNADTNYRIQRAVVHQLCVPRHALEGERRRRRHGLAAAMFVATFVQSFAVTFFSASALGAYRSRSPSPPKNTRASV